MNKYIKIALYYAIVGLASGVFYREFTKFNDVDGGTSLAFIHVHTLMLGMMVFIVLSLFESKLHLSSLKGYKFFNISYNVGLHVTIIVFIVRGVTEVLGTDVSRALDKSLSGIAGLGHMLVAAGIITVLIILNKATKEFDASK